MPCNLAVSITKAAIADKQLLELLTPEVIKTLITTFLENDAALTSYRPIRASVLGNRLVVYIGRIDFKVFVENGQVTIYAPRSLRAKAQQLTESLSTLLTKGAEKLFDEKMLKTLQGLGKTAVRHVEVDSQGTNVPATLFTLEL